MNFSQPPAPPPAPAAGTGQALPPRTRLAEFEIERVLHESSFSIVYLATDHALECPVAIKELLPSALVSRGADGDVVLRSPAHAETFERGKRAFLTEARLLAHGNHPSLVRVSRILEAHGTAYRVMPYYAGKSLLSLRQAMDEAPDEATLRALLDGLLGALETVHRMGHVHRDVSPGNILLLLDDRPVLLDSGTVRRSMISDQAQSLMAGLERSFSFVDSDATSSDTLLGPWTDLHALAAVLHFCISGQLPWSTSLVAAPVRREPLADIVKKRGLEYSPAFLAAINAALSPHPQDRPQSVAEFRAALDGRPAALSTPAGAPAEVAGTPAFVPTLNAALGAPTDPVPPAPIPAPPAAATAPRARPARPAAGTAAHLSRRERSEPSLGSTGPEWQNTTAMEGLPPQAEPSFRPSAPTPFPPTPAPESTAGFLGEPSSFGSEDAKVMAALEKVLAANAHEETSRRRRRTWGIGSAVVALTLAIGLGGWRLHEDQKIDDALAQVARVVSQDERATPPSDAPAAQATADTSSPPLPPPVAAEDPVVTPPSPSPDEIDTALQSPTSAGVPGTAPASPPATARGTTDSDDDELLRPPLRTGQATPAPVAPPEAPPPADEPPARARAAVEPEEAPPPAPAFTNPRQVCGNRTQFSLYNCMQTQCERKQWAQHAQCKRFRITDTVE
jgi:serine/threonine protein kinase